MSRHVESVVSSLLHNKVDFLPRGELFIAADFLDYRFGQFSGDYAKQLETAAEHLGLSVVGVDLNGERSRSILTALGHRKLQAYFVVACLNGPFSRVVGRHGFFNPTIPRSLPRGDLIPSPLGGEGRVRGHNHAPIPLIPRSLLRGGSLPC